jgi:hypothetical protein
MNRFAGLFAEHELLYVLQLGFMLWMLIDAYRRQAEIFWYWIILFLPFLGAAAYFVLVLLPNARVARNVNIASLFQRRASLDELTYRAEQTPTLTNHLQLAQRLLELKRPADAVPHLQAALKKEPEHASCLFALAQCRHALGEHQAAAELLEKLLARDPRWSNYTAWRLLIAVKMEAGDAAGSLAACRELVRLSPTLENQCALAEHLISLEQTDEARALLDRALREHDFAPSAIRSRNRKWARQARKLAGSLQ